MPDRRREDFRRSLKMYVGIYDLYRAKLTDGSLRGKNEAKQRSILLVREYSYSVWMKISKLPKNHVYQYLMVSIYLILPMLNLMEKKAKSWWS